MNYLMVFLLILLAQPINSASSIGMGIGGGGAQSGISFDPYTPNHLYVGTDMGLVYESFDLGKSWHPISQTKIAFDVDLNHPSHMGFDPLENLYWAKGGCDPRVSHDRGETWTDMNALSDVLPKNCMQNNTRIVYWFFSFYDKNFIGVGTTSNLLISKDRGLTWSTFFDGQESLASLIVDNRKFVHASSKGIFEFDLATNKLKPLLNQTLGSAAMGQDKLGLTLVGVEKSTDATKKVFIKKAAEQEFKQQTLAIGPFVRMAWNNSSIIYYTGPSDTPESSAIWYSKDAGDSWSQRYVDDATAYKDGIINPNPVGLFVGFWDQGFHDFQVSPSNPDLIGGSQNFFFKLSTDAGFHWRLPYTEPINPQDKITRSTFWKSTQLNPVTVAVVKRNPFNKNMIVAGLDDIVCVLSMDNGLSWRMCNIRNMNTIYDIVFNPTQPNQIYVAASKMHDFPENWYGDIQNDVPGGIYVSDDAGVNWRLLTPNSKEFINPYLSLAIDFNQNPCHMYAGTQGKGIIASLDCGVNWQRINNGFEAMESSTNSSDLKGSLIFPSIKISPKTGDVYVLHTGNRLWVDASSPYLQYTGVYKLDKKTNSWKQLGRTSKTAGPDPIPGNLYWKYPIDFAVDWSNPSRIYLADMRTAGAWKVAGIWYTADEGKSWDQVLQFDSPKRIYIVKDAVYMIGWAAPGEPFIYKANQDNVFRPLKIEIPFNLVDDAIIDEYGYVFGTYGGGLFRLN